MVNTLPRKQAKSSLRSTHWSIVVEICDKRETFGLYSERYYNSKQLQKAYSQEPKEGKANEHNNLHFEI